MSETLRDKLIRCGWVTNFNADTLVRLIERHYAALAQPEPQGPTDEKLLDLASHYGIDYVDTNRLSQLDGENAPVRSDELCIFARAVLTRWGCSAIKP